MSLSDVVFDVISAMNRVSLDIKPMWFACRNPVSGRLPPLYCPDLKTCERDHPRAIGGAGSLDDFLRAFFGQRDTDPIVVTYTREDVEAGLAAVQPYDWHAFIESRVYAVNAAPPTPGFDASGWRLIYSGVPNAEKFMPTFASPSGMQAFSIGALVRNDGTIDDVVTGSPAYEAGLGPHMTIVSVDGRSFSIDQLVESVAHPSDGRISIGVKNFDSIRTYDIRYAGGVRYPHLEQIPGRRDFLSEILRARPVEGVRR